MPTNRPQRPGLTALDDALAAGDVEAAREALLLLDPEERAVLEAEMGPGALAGVYRLARSRRRGPDLGRVIVLPGLMGTELDSVDASGDADLVWLNYFRIFAGRMADLQLTGSGDPPAPPPAIRPKQLYRKVYLPILLTLQSRWRTRPFPYDWRVDVDRSAVALAEEVRAWAGGEPCHLVAHSMGGVVARRFIQKFPEVWASMQDPSGRGRGGRLVMMGTPNRGSYAVALALSGEERTVRSLALLDVKHDLDGLLRILNTFVGSYQLLPSAKLDLGGDDHRKLFDVATWGRLPVHQGLLDRGKAFMTQLDPVIDPGRLVFVGGYNQETPHRIHVDGPGRFRYESTLEGDGRVPHETGVLDGVATFWVMETHGDLPKNPKVLAAVHDLLKKGTTAALETRRAAVRSPRPSVPYDPTTKEAPDPRLAALAAAVEPGRGRERGPVALGEELAVARVEGLAVEAWLGPPPAAKAATTPRPPRGAGPFSRRS
jgi:pimeloyl-ACP methyl ester carboxylesterase